MRRLALTILVAFLTFTASGVSALIVDEPCTGFQETQTDDGDCPPTCVTCGCCAQAVEPAHFAAAIEPEAATAAMDEMIPSHPRTHARDILHVPKLRLA